MGRKADKSEVNQKLPWTEITAVKNIKGELWFGSTKGAFKLRNDGKYDYYASKRWLVDDHVVDIASGPDASVLIVTKEGLSQINFTTTTIIWHNLMAEIFYLKYIALVPQELNI